MNRPPAVSELFDAEFLESLTRLRIRARRVARGGRHAEQRSLDLGSGIEFRDFRPYSPGDDFRAIDWNIYRRLGRVFLRLFEELEDLPVYLIVDTSESMFLETPPRGHAALRCALALTAVALNQHDSVGLFPFSDDLEVALRPQSGKGRLFTFAEGMARLEPGGSTNFDASLRRFRSMRLRRGLAVVISDFFDARGAASVVQSLKLLEHRILLVQLVRASDRDPDVRGDLRLLDCESGAAEDVSATAAVLESYRHAYDRFQGTLIEFTRSRGAGLLRLDADVDIVPQLATLFESGNLLV